MKCPECSKKTKPRGSGRANICRCGYTFVFDPDVDGITDGKFAAIVRKASQDGTLYFTENQLYTAYCESLRTRSWFGIVIVATILALVFLGLKEAIVLGLLFTLLYLIIWPSVRRRKVASHEQFKTHLAAWEKSGKNIPGMISKPSLHTPPPQWEEGDIYDYGVERILVTDNDLLVDLFVLNDFHATQRCLVISDRGYPDYLVPRVRALLDENPSLPVFYLHDSDPFARDDERGEGANGLLGHEISNWKDMGLFPYDISRMKKQRVPFQGSAGEKVSVSCLPYPFLFQLISLSLSNDLTVQEALKQMGTLSGDSYG